MLTDEKVRNAKASDKPFKLSDERGMHLLVTPAGGKLWRLAYRFGGKQKLLSLGSYPDVSLARAREKRDEARRLVADGIDPSAKRKAEKMATADTFRAVAEEFLTQREKGWAPTHASKVKARLESSRRPSARCCPRSTHTPASCAWPSGPRSNSTARPGSYRPSG
jgi:hypothetical protein